MLFGSDVAQRAEFEALARAAGSEIVGCVPCPEALRWPKVAVGHGKLDELRIAVRDTGAEMLLVDAELSAVHEQRMEQVCDCRTIDRSGLILELFADRAQSREGMLQVELAQLEYLYTRLVRGWRHLERQRGGIGLRAGPGETQLESDRRQVGERVRRLRRRLIRLRSQRRLRRRARRRSALPQIALVGYTNAGKSSCFNRLCDADAMVANQPFATLDPTVRWLRMAGGVEALASDTVGFIRALPHALIDAFRATLEELRSASLLLHVIDASQADTDRQRDAVRCVLEELGVDQLPCIEAMNKIDLLPGAAPRIARDDNGRPRQVWCSATTGAGLDLLGAALAERLAGAPRRRQLWLAPSAGALRAQLYGRGVVLDEACFGDGRMRLDLQLPEREWHKLRRQLLLE